jgi:hypothetical protein
MSADQHASARWLQVLPLIVIGVMAFVLWRPAPDPPPTREQEAKIADLAVRLGSASSTAMDLDDRLRSFGQFPPDPMNLDARSWRGTSTASPSSAITGPR